MAKVVIIDTGIDINNPRFNNTYGEGVAFHLDKDVVVMSNDFQDEVGHGTAISDIILNECEEVQIIPVKVIGINYYTEENVMIEALNYVLNNIECDVINMSLGLNTCTRSEELERIICKLKDRGTIVVSAFNNDGSMSYPAMLEDVIGVDSTKESTLVDYYEFVENSEINIRSVGGNQRVLWLSGQHKVVCGSSFATAHITAIIASFINKGVSIDNIVFELKQAAAKVIFSNESEENQMTFSIKKAIAFPYNKEMHSVVKFENNLTFELIKICDVRESGNVGKSIVSNVGNEYVVQNIFKIDWNDNFDTIIIGHINVLEKMLNLDIKKYLLLKCKLHRKKIYSFDYISKEIIGNTEEYNFFCPYINSKMLPQNTYGKLYHINKPVLGVFGTGSKQGKFTLQMILKNHFLNDGYKVGHLGTEPSAFLFGCSKIYPMGYENSVDIKGFDSISLLNKYMFDIAHDSEIIIVGSQSNTVPPLMGNQCYYTTKQIEFLMGTQPDAVILCFNAHDNEEYISRTITSIENLVETKVIASVMFPLKLKAGWAGINGVMEKVSEKDIEYYKNYFSTKHDIPMFFLDDEKSLMDLYNNCINYFSE